MENIKLKLSSLGQWLGLAALIAGIALMVYDNRAPGETVIAIASLIYAISTKIKYYRKRGGKNEKASRLSDTKSKGKDIKGSLHKGNKLGDADRGGSYVFGMYETGTDPCYDGSRSKRRLSKRGAPR
jgi:hypothetical protein